jgi:hypothetical protein
MADSDLYGRPASVIGAIAEIVNEIDREVLQ